MRSSLPPPDWNQSGPVLNSISGLPRMSERVLGLYGYPPSHCPESCLSFEASIHSCNHRDVFPAPHPPSPPPHLAIMEVPTHEQARIWRKLAMFACKRATGFGLLMSSGKF